ncbi:MAG TPA: hypothetical protein VFZ65_07150 [Planctomycetota bacterium]|nr:hypothetical protein [Planctomycetota bacterium]
MRMRCGAIWLVAVGMTAACAGTPATAEQRHLAERRLLEPFLHATEVGCSELDLEITGNFYGNVGQPAIDKQVHTAVRQRGDGYVDTIWTNPSGAAGSSFVVTIGEPSELAEPGAATSPRMKFQVVNQVRLRVYEDQRPLTLNARAGGAFVFVMDAAGKAREVKEFAVVDGALRTP